MDMDPETRRLNKIREMMHSFIFRRTCKYNSAADMDYQIATARQLQVVAAENATEEIGQQEVQGNESIQYQADTDAECNASISIY